jgi:hypothetical protein
MGSNDGDKWVFNASPSTAHIAFYCISTLLGERKWIKYGPCPPSANLIRLLTTVSQIVMPLSKLYGSTCVDEKKFPYAYIIRQFSVALL